MSTTHPKPSASGESPPTTDRPGSEPPVDASACPKVMRPGFVTDNEPQCPADSSSTIGRQRLITAYGMFTLALLTSPFTFITGNVRAQQGLEPVTARSSGATLFRTYCATCHGKSGKGDGPLADRLRFLPADLTLLARRSAGKFDGDKVYRMIDGRNPIKGHGGPDMPIWGDAFKASEDGYSEKAVATRIQAIVEYLRSTQVK